MTLDIEAVAAHAQSLPDVTEGTHWGNRTWKVAGKAFLWERPFSKADLKRFGDDRIPDEPIIAIRTEDLQDKLALLDDGPTGAFDIPHFANYPAYLIELARAEDAQIREAITDGWLAVAPPKLAQEFLAD